MKNKVLAETDEKDHIYEIRRLYLHVITRSGDVFKITSDILPDIKKVVLRRN